MDTDNTEGNATDGLLSVSNPAEAPLDNRRLAVSRELNLPLGGIPQDPSTLERYIQQRKAQQTLGENAKAYVAQNPEVANYAVSDPSALAAADAALGNYNASVRGPVDSFISGFTSSERQFKEADLALQRRLGVEGAKEKQAELFKVDAQNGPDAGFFATAGSLLSQIAHYGTAAGTGAVIGGLATAETGPGALVGVGVGAATGINAQLAYDALGQSQASADRLEHMYSVEIGPGSRALWAIGNVAGTLLVNKFAGGHTPLPGLAEEVLLPLAQKETSGAIIKEAGKALLRVETSGAAQMAAFTAVNQYTEQFTRAGNDLPNIFNDPGERSNFYDGLFHAAALGAILATPSGFSAFRDSYQLGMLKNKVIEQQAQFEAFTKQLENMPPAIRDKFADDNFTDKITVPNDSILELYAGRSLKDPLGPLANIPDLEARVKKAPGGMVELKPSEYLNIAQDARGALKDKILLGDDYTSLDHIKNMEEAAKAEGEAQLSPQLTAELTEGETPKVIEPTFVDALKEAGENEGTKTLSDTPSIAEMKTALKAKATATRLFTSAFIENPETLGMTKAQYKLWATAQLKAQNFIIDKAQETAETIGAKKLTREWKEERETWRDWASARLDNEPGQRIYRMLSEVEGLKLYAPDIDANYPRPFKLKDGSLIYASDLLKPFISDEGIRPGLLATTQGMNIPTGKELIGRLLTDEILRRDAGETRKAYYNRRIEEMLDRKMEEIYDKDLDALIDENVRRAVLSAPRLVILDHELRALGNLAGEGKQVTTDGLKYGAELDFGELSMVDAARVKVFERAADMAARKVETSLLKGDTHTAWLAKQKQYKYIMQIEMSDAARKEIGKFSKRITPAVSEEMAHGYDAETMTGAQVMLRALGFETARSGQDIAAYMRNFTPRDFVDSAIDRYSLVPLEYHSIVDRVVNDYAATGKATPLEEMSWNDASAAMRTVQAVLKLSRKVAALEKRAKDAFTQDVADNVAASVRDDREAFNPDGALGRLFRGADSWLKMMPAIALRIDKGDTTGWFHSKILRPLQEASTSHVTLKNNFAEYVKENWPAPVKQSELDREIINYSLGDFKRPGEYLPMTREKLRAMMLHIGNDDNMTYLIQGMNSRIEDPRMRWSESKVWDFIHSNAKPEDFNYVQAVWDSYEKFWPELRDLAHRTVGWAPDKVEARKFNTLDGREFRGGYAPIFYDESVTRNKEPGGLWGDDWVSSYPSSRHLHGRVSVAGPLELSDMTQLGLETVMRDISFREPHSEVLAVIRNSEFLDAMERHWGREFNQGFFEQWLKDTIGITDKVATEGKAVLNLLNNVRRNYMLATLAGSVTTLAKHGTSAGLNSMAEMLLRPEGWKKIPAFTQNVAGQFISRFARHLENGETFVLDRDFVYESSEYIKNRSHVGMDAFSGTMAEYTDGSKDWRDKIAAVAGKAYNLIDQASAVPLWMVEYERAIEDGMKHTDAVYRADQSVIMAHGDGSSVNASALVRQARRGNTLGSQMAKEFSFIYGFFNHMYNRDSDWLVSRPIDMVTGRDHYGLGAMGTAEKIAIYALLYGYGVAVVKNFGNNAPEGEEHEGIGKLLAHRFAGDLPIVRNIISQNLEGFDDKAPVYTVASKVWQAIGQWQKASEGDDEAVKLKTQLNAVGQAVGIPASGQAAKTAETLRQMYTGEYEGTEPFRDLLFGPHMTHR